MKRATTKHRYFALFLAVFLLTNLFNTARAEDTVLIDVRSAEEFAQGHIEGALNMPHTRIVDMVTSAGIAKDTPIQLYCRSGRRSGVALESLEKAGFSALENLGGYETLAATRPTACTAERC